MHVQRGRFLLPTWPVIVIVLSLLLIIGAPCFTWWQMNRNPVVSIPMPTLPSPNAFDFYVKAANLLPNINPTKLTPAQRALAPAVMQLVSQGMQYLCLAPPIRSVDTHMPYLAKFRNMARFFKALSIESSEKGDWPAAIKYDQILIRFGNDLIHGSALLGALVGIACESIGRYQVSEDLNHLSSSDSRKALPIMIDINDREVPVAQIMQEEKWFEDASILEIFSSPNWREKFVQENCNDANNNVKKVVRFRLAFVNKRRSLARYDNYFNASIAVMQGSFAQRKPFPAVPDDIICECYYIFSEKAWVKMLQNYSANRLLTVQLALQAFSVEHGAYPATLEVLVNAGYLPQLPTDPFALSGSFHYSRKGAGYLLYSLGPDGKDDGGKPIMDKKDPTKPATSLQTDDHGDIVAGVNIM